MTTANAQQQTWPGMPVEMNTVRPASIPPAPFRTTIYTRAPQDDEAAGVISPDAHQPIVRTSAQLQSRTKVYEEDADFVIRTDLPGPERMFDTRKSEAMVREYIRRDTQIRSGANRILFPEYEPLSRETTVPPRRFPRQATWAEPNVVCHGRLYFEQPNSERAGWDFGYLSVPLSVGVYYYDLALLPYHWGTDPCRRYDCNSGKCLPGDMTPFLFYCEPISVSGLAAQTAVVGTGFFVFP